MPDKNKNTRLPYLGDYESYYPVSEKNKIRFEKHKRENGTFSRTLYVLGDREDLGKFAVFCLIKTYPRPHQIVSTRGLGVDEFAGGVDNSLPMY